MFSTASTAARSSAAVLTNFPQRTLRTSTSAVLPAFTSLRSLHTSRPSLSPAIPPGDDPAKGGSSFWSAILYGSKEAKEEGLVSGSPNKVVQHSKLIGRGKYVHEMVTHNVIPSKRTEYLQAAEKFYRALLDRSAEFGGVKVTGAWECVVGAVGDYTHIFEYEGYRGFDEFMRRYRQDEQMQALQSALLPFITSRQHQLVSEFSFWPSSPPRDSGYPEGGVFEMRTYRLHPGKLLEWEGAWKRGLDARRRFVQPVGAFFAQVGQLHEVHHIWQYPDMETRKATREQAWGVGGWADTVQETVRLTQDMKTSIMKPLPWSPLR